MLPRILTTRWGVVFFLLLFGQCTKCTKRNYESVLKWTLVWQPAKPLSTELPEALDLKAGITCYVSTEQATYFLNPTGEAWKFTQTGEGPVYEQIDPWPQKAKNADAFFAFVAGPTPQKGTLHVGAVRKDDGIVIYQYAEEGWKETGDFGFGELKIKNLGESYIDVVACTIQEEEEGNRELQGLIAFRYNGSTPTVILVYKPPQEPSAKEALKKKAAGKNLDSADDENDGGEPEEGEEEDDEEYGELARDTAWHYKSKTRFPQALIEIAPNKAMMLYKTAGCIRSQVFLRKEKSEYDPPSIVNEQNAERQALFLLKAEKYPSFQYACIAIHVEKKEPQKHVVPQFYTFVEERAKEIPSFQLTEEEDQETAPDEGEEDAEGDTEKGEKLPIDHSRSLVLPFETAVYLITQNGQGEPVYYKGTLGAPARKDEKKEENKNDEAKAP